MRRTIATLAIISLAQIMVIGCANSPHKPREVAAYKISFPPCALLADEAIEQIEISTPASATFAAKNLPIDWDFSQGNSTSITTFTANCDHIHFAINNIDDLNEKISIKGESEIEPSNLRIRIWTLRGERAGRIIDLPPPKLIPTPPCAHNQSLQRTACSAVRPTL